MGDIMRHHLNFDCEGATLAGTLDDGANTTGLLIVSGGNEIRTGAHRGMAMLAQELAAQRFPVFRFDRRGIGDSEGENGGFRASGPDITAAILAFRQAAPHVRRIVAFGNCDAATALVLHNAAIDALMLANPWVVEASDDLPPPAAIKDHYSRRLRDPKAWAALLSGKLNIGAALRGLKRIAAPAPPQGLATEFASALATFDGPVTVLLAERDNTAIAFADAWRSADYAALHARANIKTVTLDSASHSFASDADEATLRATLLQALR
jgi:exosortase A-associated hydrolase 1